MLRLIGAAAIALAVMACSVGAADARHLSRGQDCQWSSDRCGPQRGAHARPFRANETMDRWDIDGFGDHRLRRDSGGARMGAVAAAADDRFAPIYHVGPVAARARGQAEAAESAVVAHPAGCPRVAFCGCGVARHIFGQIDGAMRSLWLAANWLRFPRAEPAPGMVAARHGHVFAIERVLGNGLVVAYDPNSGGHQTRVHVVSLRGYHVVDPRRG